MVADPSTNAVEGNLQQNGWAYFAMVCVYLNAFIICATWQGITWTYASEIFPLDIRMMCVAISTASTWLGSFIVARATPYMITDLGYGTYFMFGGFVIVMGFWAFFCIPETKGLCSLHFHNDIRLTALVKVSHWRRWMLFSLVRLTRQSGTSSCASLFLSWTMLPRLATPSTRRVPLFRMLRRRETMYRRHEDSLLMSKE